MLWQRLSAEVVVYYPISMVFKPPEHPCFIFTDRQTFSISSMTCSSWDRRYLGQWSPRSMRAFSKPSSSWCSILRSRTYTHTATTSTVNIKPTLVRSQPIKGLHLIPRQEVKAIRLLVICSYQYRTIGAAVSGMMATRPILRQVWLGLAGSRCSCYFIPRLYHKRSTRCKFPGWGGGGMVPDPSS